MTANAAILPLTLAGVEFVARGRALLEVLDLHLDRGLRTIVIGPNGAGKSLLLRLCHGLLSPTSGRIAWGNGTAPPPALVRRRQAMVFQRPLMLRRSVIGNVKFALAVAGVPWRERRPLALLALERFGLRALSERPARLLSGGEQQLLALARVWALDPEVLFLDEPTASLDPAAAKAVEQALAGFAERGTKLIMATHDLGQARRLADEILFFHRGRLLERAPVDSFFAAPRTPQAAAFIAGDIVE